MSPVRSRFPVLHCFSEDNEKPCLDTLPTQRHSGRRRSGFFVCECNPGAAALRFVDAQDFPGTKPGTAPRNQSNQLILLEKMNPWGAARSILLSIFSLARVLEMALCQIWSAQAHPVSSVRKRLTHVLTQRILPVGLFCLAAWHAARVRRVVWFERESRANTELLSCFSCSPCDPEFAPGAYQ